MNIRKKLLLIVILTIVEISITIFAAFQISKGATFHQLNSLHLKYNAEFSELVNSVKNGEEFDLNHIEETINLVKDQPVACLEQVNLLDKFIMRQIGTYYALDLCEKDIRDANRALTALNKYDSDGISIDELAAELSEASKQFSANSTEFEAPITNTVSFILKTMIPLIVVISLFNIIFISYLSQTISDSIKNLIELLSNKRSTSDKYTSLEDQTSGELKELMIVAKKSIEKDLLNIETNKELQRIVSEKTASLQYANDELSQFAYRASHDLKSPLTTSKMFAHYVSVDIDAGNLEEAKNNSKKIYQQLEKLERFVVDILSLAKADLSNEKNEIVNFEEISKDAKEKIKHIAKQEACNVDIEINLKEPVVSVPVRFSQIIENLISNSIKYRDPKKDSPYVSVKIFDQNNTLYITVKDNGLGIPEKYHADLFQMFKRFHPDVNSGSGLGMSIVKKHIDYFQGSIEVDSSNKGTCITISISKENMAKP